MIDDPLWYKDAIIYQMHVKAFHDANGDGIGDFAGLAQRLDYIQELGVNTLWLLPFYPVAAARRRLRHRRLHQRASRLRHAGGLPRVRARGAPPRPEGHHRARHQPHVRSASVVSARAARAARLAGARVLRVERRRQEVRRHAHHLHRYRELELGLGSGRAASTTGIASSRTSPISTTTIRASSRR